VADCVNGARARMALPQHLRCRANSAARNAIWRINTYGVTVGLRPVQHGGKPLGEETINDRLSMTTSHHSQIGNQRTRAEISPDILLWTLHCPPRPKAVWLISPSLPFALSAKAHPFTSAWLVSGRVGIQSQSARTQRGQYVINRYTLHNGALQSDEPRHAALR
jgi:hypothetical protein